MNLRKKVVKSKDNDFEDMGGAVEAMRNVNRHFQTGTLPKDEFSTSDLAAYINHLIKIQENDGSWTVSASPADLGEDEKIEFITYPTFLALGTLVMADEYLENCTFEGRWDALKKGFERLELKGFGEDSLFQEIEMILMLIEGGVPSWLSQETRRSEFPSTVRTLQEFRKTLQERLDKGETVLSFGGDYRPIFELVISGLSVL